MDQVSKNLIREIQGNLPICENPYKELGNKLGIGEEEVIQRLTELKKEGCLKRIAAILRHNESGYSANALVVFKTDNILIEKLGKILAKSSIVSHCYERKSNEKWPYNLYAMTHAKDINETIEFINDFVTIHGIQEYEILNSQEELKKASMIYY
ncbi:Lrp/AsnC family transcriptional regulator [Alkalibaculum sp. M08DMB]|uniref:siroheme decarboxylase n=1 Tax=Alkalibaculum sporogenes TaxID=2655001 RepID=A0A6A7K6T5_9FIRM|nr:Lrp/AsnC family transcriptional regulator [Alkalibaculum sporogenes]MPW25095.1 Lrp/AsnC family transcriptional regulator [Alkalibaculum sporogenes]